jgi:CHAD domain-containing protein
VAYRLRADERLSRELVRVASEQIRGALSSVEHLDENPATRVHKARQHSKKLRALFRLVRPELDRAGTFRIHDGLARAAGRALTTQRDADVMLATLETLERQHPWAMEDASLARIRRHLSRGTRGQSGARELAELIDDWRFRSGARRTVRSGYLRTWRTARKRMAAAAKGDSIAAFHGWRKHVKYHLYHLRLVSTIVEEDLARKTRDAYRLQKLLGDHHDLALLDAHIAGMRSPARRHRDAIRNVIQETMELRQSQALRIGGRLF